MKAILSGQAGLAIFFDASKSWIIHVERPEETRPCAPSDVVWLLADAGDVQEFEDANHNEIVKELRQAARADRALQLVLILLDGDEGTDASQPAAEMLEGWLKDERTLAFVENRLYAAPLAGNADVRRAQDIAHEIGPTLFDFLVALEQHQAAIRTTRESWDTLFSEFLLEIDENRESPGAGAEPRQPKKQALERVAIDSGLFRYFSQSIQSGTNPDADTAVAECVTESGLKKYDQSLPALVRQWAKTAVPSYRAMIAVQLLAITECLRLKRYAQALVAGLGSRAQRHDYQGLLREAVQLTVESGNVADGRDLEPRIVNSMRRIATRWWKAAMPEEPDVSHPEVWEAVLALQRAELVRLQRYSRWRIRWLGRKALGRDESDLLGEAITATVTGKRFWARAIPLRQHLLGAIRSISTSWHEKKVEEYLESELVTPSVESPLERMATSGNPEKILEAKERLHRVRKLFEQDTIALEVVDLLGFGYTAKEIQTRLGLSSSGFAAAAKRIRRKLDSWQRSQEAG